MIHWNHISILKRTKNIRLSEFNKVRPILIDHHTRRLVAFYNWIFQTENLVDWKIYIDNRTQIYKNTSYKSYLKIKIKIKSKDWKLEFLTQYLHYIHYSNRTLLKINFEWESLYSSFKFWNVIMITYEFW